MKYYIISGEASGDLHASNLVKELKKLDTYSLFRAWGGDMLKAQGAEIIKHYRELAFMGFTEVILNIRTILKNIRFCKQDILAYKPDVLILVDYPGFNLRIAGFAKKNGIKVFYYISPQIWAWKQSRVHQIKHMVDRMFVILPFEQEFYGKFSYHVDFVGHPLLDAIEEKNTATLTFDSFAKENNLNHDKPIIAILPGSRKQEIKTMLPVMLCLRNKFTDYQFIVAGAPAISDLFYKAYLQENSVPILSGKTYDLLRFAHAALVTSGTATLETALFGVPEVVCYKGGLISYHIARRLIKTKYISLVNLIMDKPIVKELIQDEFNENKLTLELKKITENIDTRKKMKADFIQLKEMLGGKGASERTARLMYNYLRKSG